MKHLAAHRLFLLLLFSFFPVLSPMGELSATTPMEIPAVELWSPETILDLSPAGAGSFLDTKAGNLCGNHVPDIVTLRGQLAQMIVGPAIFQPPAIVDVPRVVNAMEILPSGPSFPGNIDSLVVAGPAGLELLWWVHDEANPEDGYFDSLNIDSVFDWTTVFLLAVADVDKDDWLDIIGVGYSGGISTFRILSFRGDAWTPIFEFSVDEVVKDMEVLKWKPNTPNLQIAMILEQSGLCIYHPFGGRSIYTIPHNVQPTHPDSLVRLQQEGDATDQLGWITPSALATPTVVDQDLQIHQDGIAAEVYELGTEHVVAAVAIDRDNNNYDDLILSSKSSVHQTILLSQKEILPTGPTFLITQEGVDHLLLQGSGTPTYNEGTPLAYDIDSDGDDDGVVPYEVGANSVVGLYRNESVDHQDYIPHVTYMNWADPSPPPEMTDWYMHMKVSPTDEPITGPQPTHLDVVVYTQEADVAGGQVAYGQSLNAKALTREHVDVSIYEDFNFKLDVVGDIHDGTFAPIYHVHLRFIRKESDNIVKVWPTEVVWVSNLGVMYAIKASEPQLDLELTSFYLGIVDPGTTGVPPETGSSGSGGVSGPSDPPANGGDDNGTSEGGGLGG